MKKLFIFAVLCTALGSCGSDNYYLACRSEATGNTITVAVDEINYDGFQVGSTGTAMFDSEKGCYQLVEEVLPLDSLLTDSLHLITFEVCRKFSQKKD